MTNIKMSVKDGKLIIEVDLTQEHGKSASGKSTVIASSRGNVQVPGAEEGVMAGINIYKKV